MPPVAKHDYALVAKMRDEGSSWTTIAEVIGANSETLRGSFSRWLRTAGNRELLSRVEEEVHQAQQELEQTGETASALLSLADVARITSLEDLVSFFKVDTEKWAVGGFKINKWETSSAAKGVVPLYQVKAHLTPRVEENAARAAIQAALEDLAAAAPAARGLPLVRPASHRSDEPVLLEVAIFDAHIGMLGWSKEVGSKYDSDIAARDYSAAAQHLLGFSSMYNVERILFVVGNDLLHVDAPAMSGKGTNRGGATTAGTSQDIDSRLARMFTTARRAVVDAIDHARQIAKVDVLVVPGNHDSQQMYRLGEVLSAWYRTDPEVTVTYGPNKRKYYSYGANLLMFTHGEEYMRQRDNLPLIMATECPAEMWVGSTHREIHTGHRHAGMEGRYTPTSELTESRSIRTRSLPGLTGTDAWHYEEGYAHRRAATALVFRKTGGIAGLHEFTP